MPSVHPSVPLACPVQPWFLSVQLPGRSDAEKRADATASAAMIKAPGIMRSQLGPSSNFTEIDVKISNPMLQVFLNRFSPSKAGDKQAMIEGMFDWHSKMIALSTAQPGTATTTFDTGCRTSRATLPTLAIYVGGRSVQGGAKAVTVTVIVAHYC